MLNPFPELLVYGVLAPLLIRLAAGTAYIYISLLHYRAKEEMIGLFTPRFGKLTHPGVISFIVLEFVTGVFLIAGAWTQIAALVAAALAVKSLMLHSRTNGLTLFSKTTSYLLIAVSLSLLFSGAGHFAVDIPL